MKIINCHAIDKWDGGDRQNFAFYLDNPEQAAEYKKNNPNDHVREVTLVIYESLEEESTGHKEMLRKQAMAKLTPEELLALGLKP